MAVYSRTFSEQATLAMIEVAHQHVADDADTMKPRNDAIVDKVTLLRRDGIAAVENWDGCCWGNGMIVFE